MEGILWKKRCYAHCACWENFPINKQGTTSIQNLNECDKLKGTFIKNINPYTISS